MNHDVSRRVQAAYDQVVDIYAERNHRDAADFLNVPIRMLSERAGATGRILDLGCGTGRDMAQFERQGANIIGGDLSSGMLKFAQKQVTSPLIMMDMRTLPFVESSFAGVWSCASLLHIPKAEAPTVLQEIWRILTPSGMLILSIQEGDGEQWDGGYVEGIERFFARYQNDEMRAMLTGVGFNVEATAKEAAGKKVWLRFTCVKP